MTRRIVGPFNRVEGDLEVQLDIEGGAVREAWVNSSLFRGFEQILHGKDPRDALVYTPRICGICSVSQSVAAALALADSQRLAMAPNGARAVNLMLAAENLADHFTHFYLFFMPDFARDVYRDRSWFDVAQKRFKAVQGTAATDMLPARADFLHLMGLLAGKWPHSLAIQPGGSTRSIEAQVRVRLMVILGAFRQFLERVLFGDRLEAVAALDSAQKLQQWMHEQPHIQSDFRLFLHIADDLALDRLGRAGDRFMSYGVYRDDEQCLFPAGVWENGISTLDPGLIAEDISHSWLHGQDGPKHPFQGATLPQADVEGAYTWCKAPRLDGRVMEVGALARQVVAGHPLIRDLVRQSGGNVRNRIIARMLELALVLPAMEDWVRGLKVNESFCLHAELPDEAEGAGMTEAARGSLGHWLRIRNGRILNYQIVAPTTWNFSPRDSEDQPGALETALVGAPVREGEDTPVAVQHIVRSFDPCMVCTVH